MSPATPKRENPLINIVCNIVLPTVILMKFSTDRWLGPLWGLIVALIFPVGYGIYDLVTRKKTNFLSILGFFSVLLSGGLALAKVGGLWFAVKDGLVPTLIGAAVLLSLRSKTPLVRELIYNESFIDVPRVDAALAERGEVARFETLLRRASIGLALTFLASAPVNFLLALYVLTSPPGTPEFNAELGKMHWLALLVIALPSMAAMMVVFWKLMTGLAELTGLSQDEIFREPAKEKKE
ncbi:MAG: MFS transporter [Opitutus sp.]|nr:MFS transporter [Opitutus sp.]